MITPQNQRVNDHFRCITNHTPVIFSLLVEDFVRQSHLVYRSARCLDMD